MFGLTSASSTCSNESSFSLPSGVSDFCRRQLKVDINVCDTVFSIKQQCGWTNITYRISAFSALPIYTNRFKVFRGQRWVVTYSMISGRTFITKHQTFPFSTTITNILVITSLWLFGRRRLDSYRLLLLFIIC